MSQCGKLLNFLEQHPAGITQLEAFNTLGICRLSERVREIKDLGIPIEHIAEKTPGGARVVRYKLFGKPIKTPFGTGIEVMIPPQGPIYNSVVNDPTTWDATPMIDA